VKGRVSKTILFFGRIFLFSTLIPSPNITTAEKTPQSAHLFPSVPIAIGIKIHAPVYDKKRQYLLQLNIFSVDKFQYNSHQILSKSILQII
jgi:hypothetical protein